MNKNIKKACQAAVVIVILTVLSIMATATAGGTVYAADNVTITENSTLEITFGDNVTVSANVTGIDISEIDIGLDDLTDLIDTIWTALITFLLVVVMLAIALIEKYPGDYYLAGFTVLLYSFTQFTALQWMVTVWVLTAILLFWKGAARGKELKKK